MNSFHPIRFPFISLLTLLPLAGAFAVLLLGRASRSAARLAAATFATAAVAYTCVLWHLFQPAVQGMQLQGMACVGAIDWASVSRRPRRS